MIDLDSGFSNSIMIAWYALFWNRMKKRKMRAKRKEDKKTIRNGIVSPDTDTEETEAIKDSKNRGLFAFQYS